MLHWFSPLPPAHTGIAHYTALLLPELAAAGDVTLWTDQKQWDPALERYAAVRRFSPDGSGVDWALLNTSQAVFYNLGNNGLFHRGIWEVSRRHPGIVILHDLRLHDFFGYIYREVRRDRRGYLALMESIYGADGRRDAQLYWDATIGARQMAENYSCLEAVISTADAVVAHSAAEADGLRTSLPVHCCQLPYAASPAAPAPRTAGEPLRLVLFGYLGPNRCVDALLSALDDDQTRGKFHLDIYGDPGDPSALASQVRRLRLGRLVTVHGFVPEAELEAALSSAHLAINLRYPTMGEASISQLRIWSHGLASIVTKVGWYAALPADAVAFVRPESTLDDLREHLRRFAADPAPYFAMGVRGRELLEREHHPREYARTILSFAAEAPAVHARHNAYGLADRAGEALQGWMRGRPLDACSASAARAILELTGEV